MGPYIPEQSDDEQREEEIEVATSRNSTYYREVINYSCLFYSLPKLSFSVHVIILKRYHSGLLFFKPDLVHFLLGLTLFYLLKAI